MWFLATVGLVGLLRFVTPPTSAFMVQRRVEAWRAGDERFALRYSWVSFERLPPSLRLAVVSGEDQRFPSHFGFDVSAIADAVEDRLDGKSRRGASTLSQQVAKNLFLWPGRSFVRKGLEAYFTVLLEVLWPKRRILEVHLNVAEFGNGIYGAEAASQRFFGKPASWLSLEEASLMVAVLPSPRTRQVSAPSARVRERAEWIATQARNLGTTWLASL